MSSTLETRPGLRTGGAFTAPSAPWRLDRPQASLWGRAMTGDVAAIAQARRIIETRIRLLGLRWTQCLRTMGAAHGRLHIPAWHGDRQQSQPLHEEGPSFACHALLREEVRTVERLT